MTLLVRPTAAPLFSFSSLLSSEQGVVQGVAERTPLFEKRINSKPKKIRQMFFYFWKAHRLLESTQNAVLHQRF